MQILPNNGKKATIYFVYTAGYIQCETAATEVAKTKL